MRSAFLSLALALVLSSVPSAGPATAGSAKAAASTAARQRTRDAMAEAYKIEQQARLVYWVYNYRQALAALRKGGMHPVRPYPRQPVIDALFERMSPGAQAHARRLQAVEKRTMATHAPDSTVDRDTVIKGIQAILAGLHEEQKLLDAMPIDY